MTDRVIYETARRMEAAGFPKPEIKFGQVWYQDIGVGIPSLIISETVRGIRIADGGGNASTIALALLTFAPSATDILKFMPDAALTFFTNKFVVIEMATGDYLSDYLDNPAEAAAEAWLAQNEKNENNIKAP